MMALQTAEAPSITQTPMEGGGVGGGEASRKGDLIPHDLSPSNSGAGTEFPAHDLPPPPCTEPSSPIQDGGINWYVELPDLAEDKFVEYLETVGWEKGRTKHEQTYDCFLRAASLKIDAQFAFDAIVRCITDAGGVLDIHQVERQQRRAAEYLHVRADSVSKSDIKPPRATFSPQMLARLAAKVNITNPEAALRERSPLSPETTTPSCFLDALFSRGERILIFTDHKTQGQAVHVVGGTGEGAIPTSGPNGVWYLIQPVDGERRWNPRLKKMSRRSEESVTSWRHLLLEADEADTGDWIRALMQVPLRIVAIYTSGGRSVHALIRVDAGSKADWDEIKAALKFIVVTLGADSQALTAVRLSRLPNCWRGNRLQELLFLDPQADGIPIIAKPTSPASSAINEQGGANG